MDAQVPTQAHSLVIGGQNKYARSYAGTQAPSSPFTSLPREIRNMIYHELWKWELPRSLKINGTPVELHYGANKSQSPYSIEGMPQWPLVNKTFLWESMEELHFISTWLLEPSENLPGDLKHPDRLDTKLLNLSSARDVTFRIRLANLPESNKFSIPVKHRVHMQRVLEHIQPQLLQSKLKVLRLKTEFYHDDEFPHPDAWTLDLAYLETLNLRLDRFE
jgi:hypothetical protein